MKKIFTAGVLFLAGLTSAFGQDKLVLRDSTRIACKVVEVTEEKVKYRKWNNLDGPMYTVRNSEVSYILYENGIMDPFSVRYPRVRHTFMYRSGYILLHYPATKVSRMGESGTYIGASNQIASFLDKKKRYSLNASLYVVYAGSKDEVQNELFFVDYLGIGFLLKGDYHWHQWQTGSLYSGLGFGYAGGYYDYTSSSRLQNSPFEEVPGTKGLGYQINVLGVQYAPTKIFGLYAELGYGNESILQLGYQIYW